MALICDIELSSGLSISQAYLRIDNFSGSERYLNFSLNFYIDKKSFDEEKPPVYTTSYATTFDKDRNLFGQMYEYLRTLPEYADAIEA